MRIVSGTYKGKVINAPKNFKLRPTTDIAKESLFNILNTYYDFDNFIVLDLFAGIGSISLECISRGVERAIAVEMNSKHAGFLQSIAKEMELDNLQVIRTDALTYIENTVQKFDFIFADPPYDFADHHRIPEIVFKNNLLEEESMLVIEHSATTDLSSHPNFTKLRKYGKVHFSFFE